MRVHMGDNRYEQEKQPISAQPTKAYSLHLVFPIAVEFPSSCDLLCCSKATGEAPVQGFRRSLGCVLLCRVCGKLCWGDFRLLLSAWRFCYLCISLQLRPPSLEAVLELCHWPIVLHFCMTESYIAYIFCTKLGPCLHRSGMFACRFQVAYA